MQLKYSRKYIYCVVSNNRYTSIVILTLYVNFTMRSDMCVLNMIPCLFTYAEVEHIDVIFILLLLLHSSFIPTN